MDIQIINCGNVNKFLIRKFKLMLNYSRIFKSLEVYCHFLIAKANLKANLNFKHSAPL